MILGEIFCDGIVFQRGKPIRVFGEASGCVTVTFDGEAKSVNADGKWLIEFGARACGGPYELTAACGDETVTVHDVMIGEVLLFSGQSNMQFRVKGSNLPESEYKKDPLLRIFAVDYIAKNEPIRFSKEWQAADPACIGNWSALAYMVGAKVREDHDCAVGVISCSQGATCIQTWMDDALFCAENEALAYHVCSCKEYENFNALGQLYHSMLEPLMPFSIAGAAWYQGESNAREKEAEVYGTLLSMMIADWRKNFMDETLPFCVVVIADYDHTDKKESWKTVQELQESVADYVPYAFSVKCADICESNDIHPPTKHKLAARMYEAFCKNEVL